jgi:hypothetical protein
VSTGIGDQDRSGIRGIGLDIVTIVLALAVIVQDAGAVLTIMYDILVS